MAVEPSKLIYQPLNVYPVLVGVFNVAVFPYVTLCVVELTLPPFAL